MFNKTRIACLVAATLLLGVAQAQETASAIRGQLANIEGQPIAGVQVEVTHLPTGSKKIITTSENGIFQASGLTVGGPYKVELLKGTGYYATLINDLYLQLGKTAIVDIKAMHKNFDYVGIRAPRIMPGKMKKGPSAEFNEQDIAATPTISRDIKALLQRESKIMVDPTADGGPAMSIAGASVRGNSFTIDGVKLNDDFGLNKNGYPGRRSPVSLDAVEQLSVNIAPFDVTYGDFQGGNVNVVTKSGTNDLTGSFYLFRSDDRMIGDRSENQDLNIGEFSEDTWGFSAGGAIVEDKLFFFASYEKFKSNSPYQFSLDNEDGVGSPNEKIGVTQADFDQIAQIARDVWQYDIGGYDTPKKEQAENLLLKFDWYINNDHRAALTYMDNDGNTVRDYWGETFPNALWATAESNRYNQEESVKVYSLQLFSDWNEDFSTAIKLSNKKVETSQMPLLGANFGQMLITTPHGGQLYIGPDQFRHANTLRNERTTLSLKGEYYLNDSHNLTFGWDHEQSHNVCLQPKVVLPIATAVKAVGSMCLTCVSSKRSTLTGSARLAMIDICLS